MGAAEAHRIFVPGVSAFLGRYLRSRLQKASRFEALYYLVLDLGNSNRRSTGYSATYALGPDMTRRHDRRE